MGWLIFLGIILFVLGILMLPVRIVIDYKNKLTVKIKFLVFFEYTLIPTKKKEQTEKQKKRTETKEKEPKKQKKQKRKMTVEEIVDTVINIVNQYGTGAKMILRNIRLHSFELYWKVGAEDAASCGIKYGKICAWLSGVMGFFRNFVKVEHTELRVFPDFICEKDKIYGGADIELNPLVVLIGAIRMAFVFLKNMFKHETNADSGKNIKAKENIGA